MMEVILIAVTVGAVVSLLKAIRVSDRQLEWDLRLAAPPFLVGLGAAAWLWPHLGARRPAVTASIVVISAMVWGAFSVAFLLGSALAAGAVLFFVSDLTVARHRFVTPEFLNRAIGLPLHYAGQILIALSV